MSEPAPPFPGGRREEDAPAFGPREVRTLIWSATVLGLGLIGALLWLRLNGGNPWAYLRDVLAPGGLITTALALAGWYLREKRNPQLGGLQREAGRQASAIEDVAANGASVDGRLNDIGGAIINNQRAILGLIEDLGDLRREVHGEPPAEPAVVAATTTAPVPGPTRRSRRLAATGAIEQVNPSPDVLPVYVTAVPPDPAAIPLPEPLASEARYTSWDELVHGRAETP